MNLTGGRHQEECIECKQILMNMNMKKNHFPFDKIVNFKSTTEEVLFWYEVYNVRGDSHPIENKTNDQIYVNCLHFKTSVIKKFSPILYYKHLY